MYTRRGWIIGAGAAGVAALLPAAQGSDWTQFRGPDRNGISKEPGLLRKWPAGGPKVRWSVPVTQGYAAAAIVGGRVYHHDYDEAKSEWCVNCRSLADGKLIWQFREAREIRPNHAITRTIPAVDSRFVCSLDPKAVLHCLDVKTSKQIWRKSLVTEYKATIPSWYNGQNPLQEADRLIVAKDGKLLWEFPRKFNVAVAPSPIAVDDERVFMTASYDAGSVMVRVRRTGEAFKAEAVFDMKNNEWNSEVHTPIVYQGHLFAVGKKKRGLFTCLSLDGNPVWTSEGKASFGLGSFLMADDLFFVLDGDTGKLRLIEATTKGYNELAGAQVLAGQEVWGPMALSDGKLVLRDLTKMVCLDVRGEEAETTCARKRALAG